MIVARSLCMLSLGAACVAGCSSAAHLPNEDVVESQGLTVAARNGAQPGGIELDANGNYVAGDDRVNYTLNNGYGIIRVYAVLGNPGDGASSGLQARLGQIFQAIRDGGRGSVKVFVRFYYATPLTWKSGSADSASRIRRDIGSVQGLINGYRDVIPFLQAGFLGPWGEWWGGDLEGSDYGTDSDLRTLKTGVVDALKAAFPGMPIQMRYPRDIATYYANDAQIAFHDDAILAGSDDQGTFYGWKGSALWPGDGSSTQQQRDFMKSRSARLASLNAGEASEETPSLDCGTLLNYLATYNIRVFNTDWPSTVSACAGTVKSGLTWPATAGTSGGGTTTPPTTSGAVLGCWATDQRPWQYCYPSSCGGDRCQRTLADSSCNMYIPSSCHGTWPPAGYSGDESTGPAPTTPSTPSGGGPTSQTVLGCWAPDQRPWQHCIVSGCASGRCKRASSDASCSMYQPSACLGSWPPAGYPGEEF